MVVVRIVMTISIIAELLTLTRSTFYSDNVDTGVCCHGGGGACPDAAEADDVMTNSGQDRVHVRKDEESSARA